MIKINFKLLCSFFLTFIFILTLIFPIKGQTASLIDIYIDGDLEYSTSPVILRAIGLYSDGSTMDITNIKGGEWKSSNTDIATVYGGKVKFKGETGLLKITFSFNSLEDYVETEVTEEVMEDFIIKFEGELDPNKKNNSLEVYKLYPDGTKEDLNNSDLEWSSSNHSVATVNEKGKITFTGKPGKVTIRAQYGNRSVSETITVPSKLLELKINESLNFTPKFLENPPKLTVTGKDTSGQTRLVYNLQWSSSNENIATINNQGQILFTGNPGKVTFTAKYDELSTSIDCNVPEIEEKEIHKIYIDKNLFYGKEPQLLSAYVLYTDGTTEEITKEAQWTSSNENIASVKEGKVFFTGLYGPVEIICRYQGFSDSVQTLVTAPNEQNQLSQIKFENHFLTINDNGKKLTIYGIYTDNTKKTLENVHLTSLQPNIAYIKNNALILTGNPGKATIIAQAYKFRNVVELEVFDTPKTPQFIKIIGNLDEYSKTKNLKAVAVYSDGTQEDITAETIWNTSNRNIANFSNNNKLEITGFGPVKISAYYNNLQAFLSNKAYYQYEKSHPIKTNLISLEKLQQKLETKLKQDSFLPIPSDIYGHWAQKEIKLALKLGWIGGFPDGTIRPDKTISRGEFAALLQRALNLKATNFYINYNDIQNHWAQSNILILANLGIIPLSSNSDFRPNDPLTREEMAQMLANLINVRSDNYFNFLDVPPNHRTATAIANVYQAGIMNGMDDLYFKPYEPATRAQAITTILRLLKTVPQIEGVLARGLTT